MDQSEGAADAPADERLPERERRQTLHELSDEKKKQEAKKKHHQPSRDKEKERRQTLHELSSILLVY